MNLKSAWELRGYSRLGTAIFRNRPRPKRDRFVAEETEDHRDYHQKRGCDIRSLHGLVEIPTQK
jgi:hypothetical protein